MKQIVLKTIENITNGKREEKRFPDFVLDIELRTEIMIQVKSALHDLRKKKKVKFGHTLNHKFIELIENEKKGE